MIDLVESIDVLLTEAKKLTGPVVEKLRPNDTVLVYHATISKYMQAFLNGVDTTQVMRRVYGGPKHPGLFVSPTFEGTHSFRGSGGVIEFETKARNLHGTDYSGRTRKEQEGRGFDFSFKDKEFPNSFRPYLSFTLSQSPEPQALHMGIIRPEDIKRVHYEGKWMTPDE